MQKWSALVYAICYGLYKWQYALRDWNFAFKTARTKLTLLQNKHWHDESKV